MSDSYSHITVNGVEITLNEIHHLRFENGGERFVLLTRATPDRKLITATKSNSPVCVKLYQVSEDGERVEEILEMLPSNVVYSIDQYNQFFVERLELDFETPVL